MSNEEDDFSRFKEEDDRGLKPIDLENLPVPPRDKARHDEIHDPIRAKEAQDKAAAEARRARHKDAEGTPQHLLDAAPADINYVKMGENVDLLRKVPSLRKLDIGMGWDQRVFEGEPADLDLSIFLLDRHGRTRMDGDFIFYNNLTTLEGAVRHTGDNRSGAGDGDDEGAYIDLNGLPYDIAKVIFVLSVYDEMDLGRHLDLVRNVFIRLVNHEDGREICRFQIPEDKFGESAAIRVAELTREGPKWFFQPLSDTVGRGGLALFATEYGIIVKELQSTGIA